MSPRYVDDPLEDERAEIVEAIKELGAYVRGQTDGSLGPHLEYIADLVREIPAKACCRGCGTPMARPGVRGGYCSLDCAARDRKRRSRAVPSPEV